MLRAVPVGGGDDQLRRAHAVAVMHVDLAAAEADLLLVLAANAGERIRRRRLVEEDRDGTVGGGLWKRIIGQDLRHLGGAAHEHADRRAGIGVQSLFECGLDRRLRLAACEDDVAACNIGAHGGVAELLAHGLEFAHRQFAGAADIHGTQQCDERTHGKLSARWRGACRDRR
jgi:hypothetical protein